MTRGADRVLAAKADFAEYPHRRRARQGPRPRRRVGEMFGLRHRAVSPRARAQPDGLPEVRVPPSDWCARATGVLPRRRGRRTGRRDGPGRFVEVQGFEEVPRPHPGGAESHRREGRAGCGTRHPEGTSHRRLCVRVFLHGRLDGLGGGREVHPCRRSRVARPDAADLLHRHRRRAHAGGPAIVVADGQDLGRARPAARRTPAIHRGAHASDDRRCFGKPRDAGRHPHRRTAGADRIRGSAGDRADGARKAAGRLPALRVPARAWRDRHDLRPPPVARPHRRPARDPDAPRQGGMTPEVVPFATRRAVKTLDEWLAYQQTVHPRGIEMGLERVGEVWRRMASPRPAPVVITVGGTNGKGSTVAFLEAMLRAGGMRVGAYTSPHLLRYNERVRMDGAPVADAALIEAFERVEAARLGEAEAIPLTYFEYGTLGAFDIFARSHLDVALLEVGLGGRLDAVNIVDADCAVVVTVDLDHMEYLGPDRESIGREKAGIFRGGRPAVVGETDPPRSGLAHARAIGAHVEVLGLEVA